MDKMKGEFPNTVIMSETHMMTILVDQLGLTEAEALEWMAAAPEMEGEDLE